MKRAKKKSIQNNETPLQAAFRIWCEFVVCHRDYKPELADLYSKQAKISQFGRIKGHDKVAVHLNFDPKQWKKLMPKLMADARQKGDWSSFTDWAFEEQPDKVVVTSTRRSEQQNYSAPHQCVIAKAENDEWLIVEEVIEVQKGF